ncbi:MAG: DNA-processing protein DprA [Hymenobacteraceae bacterium]|nr:DNA-processing protein DprA [Hymenobacteraceae bacterium]MDX5396064.1 DNA-processing protein DprA [Hymenobacteraceae bacterium]MDX5512127.1 DNA-processing protein DprA [Hymenobacteraceae bacterium]
MNESSVYEVAIGLLPRVGSQLTRQLVSYCGSAKAVFSTPVGKLEKIPGIGKGKIQNVLYPQVLKEAEAIVKQAEQQEVKLLFYTNPAYPDRLKTIPDAPTLLYFKGKCDFNVPKVISIVGTRNNTDYGKRITEQLVQDLIPYNPLIISGLAYGIDITAHRAAVQHNLATVGVMASGQDIIYPTAHKSTAEKMLNHGGLLTENTFGTKPDAPRFPARNRIIAGISDCTIIVEANAKGGALITADIADSYGKDVLAVPGNIDAVASAGCNYLIKSNKAHVYTSVNDLVELLNWDLNTKPAALNVLSESFDTSEYTPDEVAILKVLAQTKEELLDNLSWKTQLPVSRVASLLLQLEFKGAVKSLPGKKYQISH